MSDFRDSSSRFERRLGRLMIAMTYLAVGFLVIGVFLLVRAGISPMAAAPAFEAGRLWTELTALEPSAFLWIGLVIVIATPIARVAGAAIGYARRREALMTVVSIAILGVIGISVLAAIATV